MAKLDGQAVIKYLALGAGAVAIPAVVGNIGGFGTTLANIPMWTTSIYQGITLGGIILAGLGLGVVDQLFFGK